MRLTYKNWQKLSEEEVSSLLDFAEPKKLVPYISKAFDKIEVKNAEKIRKALKLSGPIDVDNVKDFIYYWISNADEKMRVPEDMCNFVASRIFVKLGKSGFGNKFKENIDPSQEELKALFSDQNIYEKVKRVELLALLKLYDLEGEPFIVYYDEKMKDEVEKPALEKPQDVQIPPVAEEKETISEYKRVCKKLEQEKELNKKIEEEKEKYKKKAESLKKDLDKANANAKLYKQQYTDVLKNLEILSKKEVQTPPNFTLPENLEAAINNNTKKEKSAWNKKDYDELENLYFEQLILLGLLKEVNNG